MKVNFERSNEYYEIPKIKLQNQFLKMLCDYDDSILLTGDSINNLSNENQYERLMAEKNEQLRRQLVNYQDL